MNCTETKNLLAEYLGEELSAEVREAFDVHLEVCASCRAEVAALVEVQEQVRSLDTVSAVTAAERTSNLRVVRRRPVAARWTWSLLKTAAVLAIGVGLGRYTVGGQETPVAPSGGDPVVTASATSTGGTVHPRWIRLGRQVPRSSFAAQFARFAQAVQR